INTNCRHLGVGRSDGTASARRPGCHAGAACTSGGRLVAILAEIGNAALRAARLSRDTYVAAVQNQPVMRIQQERLGNHTLQTARSEERRVGEAGSVREW